MMVKEPSGANGRPWCTTLSDFVEPVATFVMANILWVVCSLPLVTLPAATAGLFATLLALVRGRSTNTFSDFFGGLRQHWRRATALGFVNLVVAAVVGANALILQRMDWGRIATLVSLNATILAAVVLLLVNLYAWPLLVTQDLPLRSLLATALRLVLVHPLWSAGLLVAAVLPLVPALFLPRAFLLTVSISASALIISWGAWRIINRYIEQNHKEPKNRNDQGVK